MIFRVIILCALLLAFPVSADPGADTVLALEQAVVPHRDRVDLARRLLGVTEIEPPPLVVPERAIGEHEAFWITNEYENQAFQVDATLSAVGEHIYLWVEAGVTVDPVELQALAKAFDRLVYENTRDLWGSEATPGIDGDPRVYGLFAYGMGPGIAAYFSSEHTNPIEAVSTSNEHEMFFFNLDTLGTQIDAPSLAYIVAHEFQHMIRHNQDPNEVTWIDEGFSKFTEVYLGDSEGNFGTALSFLNNPATQLNTWPEDAPRLPHYGAGMLFVTYFYDRYGVDALRMVSSDPADGLTAFDNTLRSMGETGVNEFFADWVLTNILMDGEYSYPSLKGLPGIPPQEVVTAYPYRLSDTANQYSTDYIVFSNLDDIQNLDIRLEAPPTVQLVPASGQRMWYSNRGDESDTTLTRAFDLSDVTNATLNYRVWYHSEHLWDYGYVMVSVDNGTTWEILPTPYTTLENPHNNAYGAGYTGMSGDWLSESISLDAYAGQQILVRFEMITDDATNQPGMLIDDVQIPEIGYSSDFEADNGGWQPQGWIWSDNTLPQQVWVQAVQQVGNENVITRWLAPADEAWTLPLRANVDQVMLAISPFAPVTTVAMPYILTVEAR
jgi:immune inhibitor A